jgi:LL-diaminopimelate aminotransferase
MNIEASDRLKALPPYLFAEIDRRKKEAIEAGKDIVNLGIGDPDQPTPDFIVEEMAKEIKAPANHGYSLDNGLPELRQTVAVWYKERFDVDLDTGCEVYPLIGSKEGIAHLPLAVNNPGDVNLIPEPCYPVYRSGSIFAGAETHVMPLRAENGFLPDLDAIPADVAKKARLMFVNYPNNPTSAEATAEFYEKLVAFARDNEIVIAADNAYSEIYYNEKSPPLSILQTPGAKEVAVEFNSLSKTFNMTGWRIGWCVGNPQVVQLLGRVKSNVDSGIFAAIQRTGVVALRNWKHPRVKELRKMYRRRRDVLCEGLKRIGFDVQPPTATFYVWVAVPEGQTSMGFAGTLLEQAGIVCTPGIGFGGPGEGFVRFALTQDEESLKDAVDRIENLELS